MLECLEDLNNYTTDEHSALVMDTRVLPHPSEHVEFDTLNTIKIDVYILV